jgi:hypothetical protein
VEADVSCLALASLYKTSDKPPELRQMRKTRCTMEEEENYICIMAMLDAEDTTPNAGEIENSDKEE